MSEKGNGKPVIAETKEQTAPVVDQDPKFLVEKLRENSISLFGVTSSTFDGAFYGCKETEMSIKDAKARINDWLGKEAK